VGDTGERDQARRGQRGFLDRRVRILLEVAQEPAGCYPLVAARVFAGDEHCELERVGEAELRQLFRGGECGEDVAAPQCPLEDRVWMALRGRRSSSLGACDGLKSLASQPLIS
jgi:hypothetical protein